MSFEQIESDFHPIINEVLVPLGLLVALIVAIWIANK